MSEPQLTDLKKLKNVFNEVGIKYTKGQNYLELVYEYDYDRPSSHEPQKFYFNNQGKLISYD